MSRGFTVLFTGLPAAGKSTLAQALKEQLTRAGTAQITLLDGDAVRRTMSADLGFSRQDRETHIRRVGLAAAEVTRQGGICICAVIAPFHAARKEVRAMVESAGTFILVHVATPLSVCEARDPKGLYARARDGLLQNFTGVSAPYEIPDDAEITVDTTHDNVASLISRIVDYLEYRRCLPPDYRTKVGSPL